MFQEDFVANAVLSDRQFIAERSANFTLVGPDGRPHGKPALEEDGRVQPLRIPRRPKWTVETSKEQLEASETRSFLEWRAAIAQLEENEKSLTVTPFEKNLEVWKQLWRVVERSDIVVQIVDARNPTFFR
jgi:large subunit GTPase 1